MQSIIFNSPFIYISYYLFFPPFSREMVLSIYRKFTILLDFPSQAYYNYTVHWIGPCILFFTTTGGHHLQSNIGLYLALIFGVFSLSTSAIFVRLANAPSAITAFFRLFFAALFLLPFLLSRRENRHQLRNLSKKQWLLGILSGLLLSAHYMLWFESL